MSEVPNFFIIGEKQFVVKHYCFVTLLLFFRNWYFTYWESYFIHAKWIFACRIIFCVFFILNLIFWGVGSSAAIPFSTLVALLALWFGVSVPLTFVGAYFGFKKRVGTGLHYWRVLPESQTPIVMLVVTCIVLNYGQTRRSRPVLSNPRPADWFHAARQCWLNSLEIITRVKNQVKDKTWLDIWQYQHK